MPREPEWWKMFEPIPFGEREEHSLIGEIKPSRTARERARRRWGMDERNEDDQSRATEKTG
jgi:hypothetical protein